VRRLWISEARRADSKRASRLRSLRRDAAIYALYELRQLQSLKGMDRRIPLLVLFVRALRLLEPIDWPRHVAVV
jgi:hypothetical protein